MNKTGPYCIKVKITGLVQGVGFRPFIYRLAREHNLNGWVENRNDGVLIETEGNASDIADFIGNIRLKAPPASNIFSITQESTDLKGYKNFEIIKSSNTSNEITEISPDIAVCKECLEDLRKQEHRIDYPFINCTNCGPRFTIIKDLPYDREMTTMDPFSMCNQCKTEYEDVLDRRFHAQPVACNNCGPVYHLISGRKSIADIHEILKETALLIENGKVVAIKGLGGYHIACDATNDKAVKQLRKIKARDGKPFAVMFRSVEALKEYTELSEVETETITSWKRPIVLLETKKQLAFDVSVGFQTIGAMLPYMPFHHLLFEKLAIPAIVLTSGNISDEPIIISNPEAENTLGPITDGLITYNREIFNRTDDSVTRIINGSERIIRRSRGYVPSSLQLPVRVDGILAAGAELVNCFCIGKDKQAFLSQHIGDLKNLETLEFYSESIRHFSKLFRVEPSLVVADLHPDYLSSKYAHETGLPVTLVQHHHAHITSVMAEYGLDEKVIGVAFDGIGLGEDGHIWGGEFFHCDLLDYERITHFDYTPMPGGDKASQEPWRMAVSYLYKAYGRDFLNLELPFLRMIEKEKVEALITAIDNHINCPLTSSTGRLFDAVSAIIGLLQVADFHAEAPMRLESVINRKESDSYSFTLKNTIDMSLTIKEIVSDIMNNIKNDIIAAKFHNTIISIIFAVAKQIKEETGTQKIVLSGGTFQNKYLLEKLEVLLSSNGFEVYIPEKIPVNDGGIALGQIIIAAKRRELQCV